MAFRVVPMQESHVREVVTVHMKSFQNFFLTFLGPRFLREFYRSFIVDPVGIAFVAEDEASGRIGGAVVGPLVPGGYFKRLLKRRWWAFCLASAGAVLRRPTVIPRLLRAVLYRGDAPSGPARALLSSIAVDPEMQGKGVGAALVQAWAQEAKRRGAPGCFLTTDAEKNEAVNRFYCKQGWKLESSFTTPQGRKMNRYVVDFAPADRLQ